MNRSISLVALILLGTAVHLPAPIVEESATPTPRIKRAEHNNSPESAAGIKQSPFGPFVGVWTGTVTTTISSSDTTTLNKTLTSAGAFVVSKDGNIKWGTNGQNVIKVSLSSDRELQWTYQNFDEHGNARWTYSLRLIDPKMATYQATGSFTSPFANATMKASATLTKR